MTPAVSLASRSGGKKVEAQPENNAIAMEMMKILVCDIKLLPATVG